MDSPTTLDLCGTESKSFSGAVSNQHVPVGDGAGRDGERQYPPGSYRVAVFLVFIPANLDSVKLERAQTQSAEFTRCK